MQYGGTCWVYCQFSWGGGKGNNVNFAIMDKNLKFTIKKHCSALI